MFIQGIIKNGKNNTINVDNTLTGLIFNTTNRYYISRMFNLNIEHLCNNIIVETETDSGFSFSNPNLNQLTHQLSDDVNVMLLTNDLPFQENTKLAVSKNIFNEEILELYLKAEITETDSVPFLDPENQWIIDDLELYETNKLIFDVSNEILNYEFVNIQAPAQSEIDIINSFSIDNYPDLTKIKKIKFSLVETPPEDYNRLYFDKYVDYYIYDKFTFDDTYNDQLMTLGMFRNELSYIDADAEPETPFSDVFDDIKQLIIRVLKSQQKVINIYGYNYKLYNDIEDALFESNDQEFLTNTIFYNAAPLLIMIPNGSTKEDILNVYNTVDVSVDEYVDTTNISYVLIKLFNNETTPILNNTVSNKVITSQDIVLSINSIIFNHYALPQYIVIFK